MLPSLPPDPEIRRLAREILEQREYARYRLEQEAWLDLFERLARWLQRLPDWSYDLALESPLLYWSLLAGLLLMALGLLAHVVWTLRAALLAPAPEPIVRDRPAPRDFLGEAERLAQQGRFLEAARRVQLACLELLLRRGVIELGRADPNRVLRRRIAGAELPDTERSEFVALLDRLEAHLFRDADEDSELYSRWLRLHRTLRTGGLVA